ncbi:MAG: TfoX/Sxy family protein [Oscillospiraceae bacterium]
MGKLSELPNIGQKLEKQLNDIGVETPEQLREIGAEKAWLKIQKNDPSACLLRLSAIEGAIWGVKKDMLPPERKEELRAFYHEHKLPKRKV